MRWDTHTGRGARNPDQGSCVMAPIMYTRTSLGLDLVLFN